MGGGDRLAKRAVVRLAILTSAVALAAVFSLPATGRAQEAETGEEITILEVFDGRYVPSGWIPLSLQIESSRAIRGEVLVSAGGFGDQADHVQPIEVPGGGTERLDLLFPAPGSRGGEIDVSFSSDGDVLAADSFSPLIVQEEVMVALLEGEAPELDGMVVEPTLDEVHPVTLDPELLELGARALDPIHYVVVDVATLDELPDAHKSALDEWVLTGGRLVITGGAPTGPPARGLLDGRVTISEQGMGEVIQMEDPSRSDEQVWAAALRPVPASGRTSNARIFDRFGQPSDSAVVSALNTGEGDVGVGWFLGFLLVYLLLVGPINYWVFKRRGSREMLWLSIPALALAFSGVAYGLARGSRGELAVRAAGAVFATAEASAGHSVVTVTSGGGGARSIGFTGSPAGVPRLDFFGGGAGDSASTLTPQGTVISFETSPFSVSAAQGPLHVQGFIEGELEASGQSVTGQITNRTGLTLVEGGVLFEHHFYELPEMEPGASVSLDATRDFSRNDFRPILPGRLKNSLVSQLMDIVGPTSLFETPIVFGFAEATPLPVVLDGREREVDGKVLMASPLGSPTATGAGRQEVFGRTKLIGGANNVSLHSATTPSFDGFRELTFVHEVPPTLASEDIRRAELQMQGNQPGRREFSLYNWQTEEWDVQPDAERRRNFSVQIDRAHVADAGEIYFRFASDNRSFMQLTDVKLTVAAP